MSNGIGRLRTMGIAKQPTFGSPMPSATYVFPLLNAPQMNSTVNKALNNAALGSAYQINNIVNTTRFGQAPLEFKIDEDQMPLFLSQRFSISTVTVSGETVAYEHTLSYQNTTQNYFTLFLQDDQRQDYIMPNVLFDNLDFTFDNDFVRVNAEAIGSYPTQSAVTNAITQPSEFVGRMASYKDDDYPGTVTSSALLSLTANLDFGINSEDTRFGLGDDDLQALNLTSDKFMFTPVRLKPDVSYYDDNENGTMKQFTVTVVDTGRFVSPTSTNPSILFTVPRAKFENYTENADLEENIQETFDLVALKQPGVSGTPMSVVIVNSVSSY